MASWLVVIEQRLRIRRKYLDRAVGSVGRSNDQILVALPVPARAAVIARHEHQIARGNLGRAHHGRRDPCLARETAEKAAREADRAEAEAWSIRMEGSDLRNRLQRPAIASMAALGGWSGMQSLQDEGEPAARR
jgi:hypothetical protein